MKAPCSQEVEQKSGGKGSAHLMMEEFLGFQIKVQVMLWCGGIRKNQQYFCNEKGKAWKFTQKAHFGLICREKQINDHYHCKFSALNGQIHH